MKYHFAPRRAFTLIEILVVIAIIALLSALLFPVFARVREEGRKTSCLSNMKQLGIAFEQYAQDSRGKYPLAANYQAWEPGFGHWVTGPKGSSLVSIEFPASATDPPSTLKKPTAQSKADVTMGALFPYVKSTAVYICPSAEYGEEIGVSYSMNCALSGLSSSRVRAPGDIVLLVDEQYPTDGYFYARDVCDLSASPKACSTDALQDRHNGGGNLLFADGHVKFFNNEQFPLDYSPEGLANKGKLTGSPRFHDRSFGSATGSSLQRFQTTPGNIDSGGNYKDSKLDSCIVPIPGL